MHPQDTTALKIEPTRPGSYRLRPPHKNDEFLEEFKRKIGPAFRCWNVFQEAWDIRPIDKGHLELVADIARRHFGCQVEIIDREDGEK